MARQAVFQSNLNSFTANNHTLSVTVPSGLSDSILVITKSCQTSLPWTTFTSMSVNGSTTGVVYAGSSTTTGIQRSIRAWYILNPTPGTYNVVGAWSTSSSNGGVMTAVLYDGVDQTTPLQVPIEYASGGSIATPINKTFAATSAGLVLAHARILSATAVSPDGSATVLGTAVAEEAVWELPAGSTAASMSWTGTTPQQGSLIALLLKPAAGGGGTHVSFSGTVPAQSATEGASGSLSLASYFSGTLTPFTYSIQAGTLPAGLSLNTSTGVISGTPTTAGTSSGIVVRATDSGSNTADTNAFNFVVAAAAGPVFAGPVTLVAYRAASFDLSYPAGDGTTVGYEVSVDAGGSWTSLGTSLTPTVGVPLPAHPGLVQVRAFNAGGVRSAAVSAPQGVQGSQVPATGDFGAAALYQWLQENPAHLSSLVHLQITRQPAVGSLVMYANSRGEYTTVADGEQSADGQPWVAGVATGVAFPLVFRRGSVVPPQPPSQGAPMPIQSYFLQRRRIAAS